MPKEDETQTHDCGWPLPALYPAMPLPNQQRDFGMVKPGQEVMVACGGCDCPIRMKVKNQYV